MGLAISTGLFVEPLKVVRYESIEALSEEIKKSAQELGVGKVVVGVSEGRMAAETKEFGRKLQERLGIPVIFQDETLTTYEAKELAIKAGIKRKKRREMEDAYSAALILQSYLDSQI